MFRSPYGIILREYTLQTVGFKQELILYCTAIKWKFISHFKVLKQITPVTKKLKYVLLSHFATNILLAIMVARWKGGGVHNLPQRAKFNSPWLGERFRCCEATRRGDTESVSHKSGLNAKETTQIWGEECTISNIIVRIGFRKIKHSCISRTGG